MPPPRRRAIAEMEEAMKDQETDEMSAEVFAEGKEFDPVATEEGGGPVGSLRIGAPKAGRRLTKASSKQTRLTAEQRVAMGTNGLAYMRSRHDIRVLASSFEQVIQPQAG